jgi:SAM-dependent methyltransferase
MAADVFGLKNESTRLTWLTRVLKDVPAGSRILDAGAGECRYKQLCVHLKYVTQDFAKYDGKGDGRGLQKKNWDQSQIDIISEITAIPEPDGSFDAVLCSEVLEHLPEPVLALAEFSRLLKKGGYLILTAPFASLTHYLAQEAMRLPDVSLRYCGRRVGYFGRILIKIFLMMLRKLSSAESIPSSELLCFGWHILAKKKG